MDPEPLIPQKPTRPRNPGSINARLQLAAIVDSSDDAILSKDLDGVVMSWNAAATRIFGYTGEEIIGQSILLLIPPELHAEEPEILRKVRSGERIEHFETQRRRKDGQIIYVSLTISPIRNASGRIVGISKIARDITARKNAEAALIQSERLAAIGRMSAVIAHEVNNPLEAVLNLGFLLSQHPSLDEEAQEYTRLLLGEVMRVSEITKQTLTFYRDSSHEERINVAEALDGVLQLHRRMIEQNAVRVQKDYRTPVFVWGRAGELRQVFMNLVMNALDAVPSGGVLRVRATTIENGLTVCVSIGDNGCGVPVELRNKIFEPFFSTKDSRGTGLGLWVCKTIVQKYGGSIGLRSSTVPQKAGTVFRVRLPARAA